MLKLIKCFLIMAFFLNCVYLFEVDAATIRAGNYASDTVQMAEDYLSDSDIIDIQEDEFTRTEYVRVSQLSTPSNLRIVDKVLTPAVPSDLRAAAFSSTQINLSWQDNSNIETSFKIERAVSSSGIWTQIAEVETNITKYSSTGLSASTTYYYRVKACNTVGDSIYSNIASATTQALPDTTAPSVPSGVNATAVSCSQITLSWSASSDTGGSGLKGYKVYRNGYYLTQVLAPSTTYADTGLSASRSYSYRVSAMDNAGNESGQSGSQSVTTPACPDTTDTTAPSVPTGLIANVLSCSQATLSWSASRDTGGSGLKGYKIYRNGTYLTEVLAPSTTYKDSGLSASNNYSYRVSAIDNAGNESCQTVSQRVTTPECPDLTKITTAPSAPSSFSSSALSSSKIKLTWQDNSTNEEGFEIERALSSAGPWTKVCWLGANVTVFTDSALNASTTYGYRIRAKNLIDYSPYSNTTAACTQSNHPPEANNDSVVAIINTPVTIDVTINDFDVDENLDQFSAKATSDPSHGTLIENGNSTFTYTPGSNFTGEDSFTYKIFDAEGEGDSAMVYIKVSSEEPLAGNILWAKGFGDVLGDTGESVAVDSENNSIIVGSLGAASADFGGGEIIGKIYLAKFSSKGQHLWSKAFNMMGGKANDVVVDSEDNIIMTGFFEETVNFGGETLSSTGSYPTFIVKFSKTGDHLWSIAFGSGSEIVRSIAVDSMGNVLVTGGFYGTLDLGGGPLTSNDFSDDIFMAKYNGETGDYMWGKRFGDIGPDAGYGIAADSSGNVVLTGGFHDTIDFNSSSSGGELNSTDGSIDIFVTKFTKQGTYLWSWKFGNTGSDMGYSVGVDSSDNIVVTGYCYYDKNDIFLAKLSTAGTCMWSKVFENISSNKGNDITVDSDDNIVVTGEFLGSIDVGGGSSVTTSGNYDIFVAKYTVAGEYISSRTFGGTGTDRGKGIAVDLFGNIIITGEFIDTVDFGTGPLTSAGDSWGDIFIVKMEP